MNIVFDVGNVLLRWSPEALVAEVFPELDAPVLAERIFAQPHWHALDRGTQTRTEVEAAAAEASGLPIADIRQLFDAVPAALAPIEPMIALQEMLHAQGIATYVLSNMPAYIQAEICARHRVFDRFHGHVFSNEHKVLKPERAIYDRLLATHGLDAASCLFIDDSVANLDAAEALGFHTLRLPPGADAAHCESVSAAVWRWLDDQAAAEFERR